MASLIRQALVERLEAGENVAMAYRHAIDDALSRVRPRLGKDADVGKALELMGARTQVAHTDAALPQARLADRDLGSVLRMIVPIGGIDDVPDAACVAERLRHIPKPTRADIEAAFKACQGGR